MVPEDRRRICAAITAFPEVVGVNRLLTMHLGPNSALVTADIHVVNDLTTDQIEALLTKVNEAIQGATPEARPAHIFLELHPQPHAARRVQHDDVDERNDRSALAVQARRDGGGETGTQTRRWR